MDLRRKMLQGDSTFSKPGAMHRAVPAKVLEYYEMYGYCEQALKQIFNKQGKGRCTENPSAKPSVKRC